MYGLILKDLMLLKTNYKNMIVMLIGSIMISVAIGNYLLAIVCVPVMILATGISTFQTDEFYNSLSYTITYPISRTKTVLSKYLFTFILLLIATYVGLMIYVLIHLIINPGFNGLNTDMLKQLLMLEMSSLLIDSIFYPVIYKYGCEKSRFVLMSIVMILLGVLSLASVYINVINKNVKLDFNHILDVIQNNGVFYLSLLVMVALVISILLSIRFYKKKDY